MAEILYLVIPCYNEEEVLPETTRQLKAKLAPLFAEGRIDPRSKVLLVDDGSKDRTWEMISALHESDPLYSGVRLSRNQGHQNALLAGLMVAKGAADIAISMDADLQDDIDVIDRFLDKRAEGCDIVYGVRSSRETDTAFKRTTARGFYRIMKALGVEMVSDHADYRLMSKRALEALSQFEEVNLFLRGIVPLVGFQSDIVLYQRRERFAGESKYPLKKMVAFAMDGITSFSVKPIRLITTLGFLIFGGSILGLFYLLLLKLSGQTVQGWTTLMGSIWMIGGIQLLCLGILGEYVGKIYKEVKHRPRFILDTILDENLEP